MNLFGHFCQERKPRFFGLLDYFEQFWRKRRRGTKAMFRFNVNTSTVINKSAIPLSFHRLKENTTETVKL